jgi:thiamine kinase-like enzyme
MKLVIVDWEFAQFGHRSYDIGQMIGDFYERKHFRGVRASLWAIDAFIEGYGSVSEDMAYRIAIHTGVQLITWVNRGPPLHMRPAWATRERVIDMLKLGMTFILKGWDKDRTWFESGVLAGLFRAEDTTIPTEGYQN